MLAVVFALSAVVVAPASAKLTKHQKAHIRKQLKRAIHKNPKLIRSKHFIKKASLVNFVLPVTVDLHNSTVASNPNAATIDLGASLGQRSISLGGSLPAEITFHDSFDGGALGNVDVKILPPPVGNDTYADAGLNTTSIPLLWNSDVNSNGAAHLFTGDGCFGFNNAGVTSTISGNTVVTALNGQPTIPPGAPLNVGAPDHFPVVPGVDDPTILNTGSAAVDPTSATYTDNTGPNPTPFPSGSGPGGFGPTPSAADSVLRTGPLSLVVAQPGTNVDQSSASDGHPQGSQDITIGKSGGQANLFGHIPGKDVGLDVTVNLATKINSIIREVDNPQTTALQVGQNWPATALNCRQAWTGVVQNYIPGVHLSGDLKISPAILPGGKLRIAKATLSTPDNDPARVALAACLLPDDTYAQNVSQSGAPGTGLTIPLAPINPAARNAAPTKACNDPTGISQLAANAGISALTSADANDGYTTSADGSQVSVAGDLAVTNVSADILIGDTP
jgi:hypothetical protein